MVGPQCGKNLSEDEPNWPIGGATATKSTKLLINPRPFDLESGFLHHCDPWLKAVKMYISKIDFKSYIKTQNFTKIDEHMCSNMVKKHAKIHGDRTIGGAITGKKVAYY